LQLIGQILQETYRIERLLGRGGKGEVYLASHMRLPRRFAVKVLFPHNAYKREEVLRFRREAEVVSALGHPNIIEVIDFNHTSWGAPYIVMEYLEGEDLSARIQRVGRLPLEATALMLKQVCSALQAAHQRGVIHRDLKPSNIFLCRKGDHEDWVKVVDFGLSKVWGASVAVTDGRLAIGTPRYMAPEQAVGRSSEADARTDVFSLGAILFRMLTGQLAFMGDSIQALLNSIVFVDPPTVTEVVSDVPEAVSRVVDRALRKRPEDRYQSMDELWAAFEEAAGVGFASVASSPGRPESASLSVREPARSVPAPVRSDPHPEQSATYTHASGEVVDPSELETELHRPERLRRRPRRARTATALVVLSTAIAVAGLGIWLGLRLVSPPDPSGPAATGLAPTLDVGASRRVVAANSSQRSTPADSGAVQRVRLRTRQDASTPERDLPGRRSHPSHRRPRPGELSVVTRSAGALLWAEVYVDGKKLGQSPVKKRLPEGSHLLVVQRPGFRSIKQRVRVKSGRTAKIVLDLEPR